MNIKFVHFVSSMLNLQHVINSQKRTLTLYHKKHKHCIMYENNMHFTIHAVIN